MARHTWLVAVCAVLMATSANSQHRTGAIYAGVALGMTWHLELEEGTGVFVNDLRSAGITDITFSTSSDGRAFGWSVYAGYAVKEIEPGLP